MFLLNKVRPPPKLRVRRVRASSLSPPPLPHPLFIVDGRSRRRRRPTVQLPFTACVTARPLRRRRAECAPKQSHHPILSSRSRLGKSPQTYYALFSRVERAEGSHQSSITCDYYSMPKQRRRRRCTVVSTPYRHSRAVYELLSPYKLQFHLQYNPHMNAANFCATLCLAESPYSPSSSPYPLKQ